MELTKEDIDVLLEALPAWEAKDVAGEMLTAIFLGLSKVPKEEREAEMSRGRDKKEAEKSQRRMRSITLQAKLIKIRDSLTADDVLATARG